MAVINTYLITIPQMSMPAHSLDPRYRIYMANMYLELIMIKANSEPVDSLIDQYDMFEENGFVPPDMLAELSKLRYIDVPNIPQELLCELMGVSTGEYRMWTDLHSSGMLYVETECILISD